MNQRQLFSFLKYLKKDNLLAGPLMKEGVLDFEEIADIGEMKFSNKIPLRSFKRFLLPSREELLMPECRKSDGLRMALTGITVPDLKAITILNHIFEKDPYYQNRLKNTLIVGYASIPYTYEGMFAVKYEEHILEHIQFDIFMVEDNLSKSSIKREKYKIFAGSEDGQRILDKFGYKNYENVQFAGLIHEEGADKNILAVKAAMQYLSPESEIFRKLGNICIECGRCSIICPLCFCFGIKDDIAGDICRGTKFCAPTRRNRTSTTCFYSEFSEVAGGHKFLKNPAERIYNWYEHKFVRLPDELSVAGCVSCGRCAKVCPVGISIREALGNIIKEIGNCKFCGISIK